MTNGYHAPLSGIRIIDFGQYLTGPLAALLLAENGADVIRVDPPGGPRWDHPANAVLQRSKRSMILDLQLAEDLRVAKDLIETADVVIEGFRPGVMGRMGIDPEAAIATNPRLIWCSLPGFSKDDPRANLPGWEGLVCSAAGLYQPRSPNDPSTPRFTAVPMASTFAAVIAAHSIVAALICRVRTGRGDLIEVPLFDAAFDAIGFFGEDPQTLAQLPLNLKQDLIVNPAFGGKSPYRCKDGRFIAHYGMPPGGLHRFFDAHLPSELKYKTDTESAQRVREVLEPLFAQREAPEWEREMQEKYGAAVATSQTTEQWLEDDDAIDSDTVVAVDDPILGPTRQAGFAVKFGTKPNVRFPRREPGADTEEIKRELRERPGEPAPMAEASAANVAQSAPGLPLAGMTAIDFTSLVAGPVCGRVLAEYGAEVIKVNRASVGWNQLDPLSDDAYALCGHRTTGAGKRTIFLDLKSLEGAKIASELIRRAHIVHTYGTDAGALKLGLDAPQVHALNSSAIYSRLRAYSSGGWREKLRGHEDLAEHATGLAMRYGGGIPNDIHGIIVNDMGTGHFAALGILLTVFDRLKNGTRQAAIVEASLAQTATFMQLPYMVAYEGAEWKEPAGRSARGWSITDQLYQTSDGWIWVAAHGADALQRLLAATSETPDVAQGAAVHPVAALAVLESRLVTRTSKHWVKTLWEHGIPAHVYNNIDTAMKDPIAQARSLSITRDHPGLGLGRDVGAIRRFRSRPDASIAPAAAPGYHTRAVLNELGYPDEDVNKLLEKRIIATDASYRMPS
jgi:crotonobetainyl-CoA:carnitine CoA-transferase CaiB-like acyl-CoA transferase